jgi:tRNA pseudouridine38-40 synthase
VSYDGTDFAGSQLQPAHRTVQGELETAAARLFGAGVRVSLAGRTDAGVHAAGQVAAFTVETRLDEATIGRALTAILPMDVAVRGVRTVPGEFDPRRWARRRWYRYTVRQGASRYPLTRRTAWFVEGDLDLAAMQMAAGELAGRQDFIACSGPLEAGRTSVRTVFTAGWRSESCVLLFDIEADAFLPHMVRRLAGALVQVGRGRMEGAELLRLLGQAEPGSIGPTAPAHGLCLQRVEYDEGYAP